MAKVVIDSVGTKKYYNDQNRIHRDDGPAVIYQDGSMTWFDNAEWKMIRDPHSAFIIRLDNDLVFTTRPNGDNVLERSGKKIWPEL